MSLTTTQQKSFMTGIDPSLSNKCHATSNPNKILTLIEDTLIPVLKELPEVNKEPGVDKAAEQMNTCNKLFKGYLNILTSSTGDANSA